MYGPRRWMPCTCAGTRWPHQPDTGVAAAKLAPSVLQCTLSWCAPDAIIKRVRMVPDRAAHPRASGRPSDKQVGQTAVYGNRFLGHVRGETDGADCDAWDDPNTAKDFGPDV
jgi:hypothetical protein